MGGDSWFSCVDGDWWFHQRIGSTTFAYAVQQVGDRMIVRAEGLTLVDVHKDRIEAIAYMMDRARSSDTVTRHKRGGASPTTQGGNDGQGK